MLPLASRRIAARCVRAPPLSLRYASTKPKASSKPNASTKPNANRGAKARLTKAFTEPAPPILARWPNIYWAVQKLIWGTGVILAFHICCEYFFTFGQAEGISMTPTMNGTGDWLLLSKMYRRGRYVKVGDLVSFKHPIDEGTFGVKRVIGMPGDFVLRDTPGTSGVMIQVPEGHCWIVGDNLTWSRDSRIFGPLPLALIKGKVIGRFSTLDQYEWSNMDDDGLKPAHTYVDEDEDVD